MKPLRSDAKLARLSALRRAEIDEMLMGGMKREKVQRILSEEDGLDLSDGALSNYYKTHVYPKLVARNKAMEAKLSGLFSPEDVDKFGGTTTHLVGQALFDLLTQPDPDPKTVKLYADIYLKQQNLAYNKERLELEIEKFQIMAAQALLDKALSPEVQAIIGGSGSYEEKLSALRFQLFGEEKQITPQFTE